MQLLIYTEEYEMADGIDHFMDFYYALGMRYLASDFLREGLSPQHISDAVMRAIRSGKASGLTIRQHFMPVFSSSGKDVISDCKLSRLGYALVLLNADVTFSAAANWQRKVLEHFLGED
ncbi:hypothetical protein [Flagellimonas lutaonensis]|uniref:Uncharacterized protein n=1 Tax=Flagellimonas lutaonensis TaxID=516051 RepID=A0A0D5YPJ0_9FLAO|nr:hypothetical protein [Allomuricauda lutaonensis]AKA34230.1 hypothetical protein VC82_556 [Allomuricauda lutaonensis]